MTRTSRRSERGGERRVRGPAWLAVAMIAGSMVVRPPEAQAAPPWVDRNLTLPGGDWAFDFGFGLANLNPSGGPAVTGTGMNVEMAVGLTSRVELGVRTGLRFSDDPNTRNVHGDQYGRLFDRQYFDGGNNVVANPEVRVVGALVRSEIFELGLEGRLIVPVEGNDAGALFGVPMMLHLGRRVRLDFGAYVPIIFGNGNPATPPRIPTNVDVNLPIDVWIQASPRLWLGPMSGVVFRYVGRDAARADLSLGFGLGYQITHYLDFKTMVLVPYITDPGSGPEFGVGAGVEIRIE